MLQSALYTIIACLAVTAAYAQSSLSIEQVPPDARLESNKAAPLLPDARDNALQPDHQAQILNDPVISDYGRANALVGFTGNEAPNGNNVTITQDALGTGTDDANRVVVHQNGNNNSSKVTQKGHDNDLYLDQLGNHNRSDESQIGEHNHKIKVQNGVKQETTDDPYDNKD